MKEFIKAIGALIIVIVCLFGVNASFGILGVIVGLLGSGALIAYLYYSEDPQNKKG